MLSIGVRLDATSGKGKRKRLPQLPVKARRRAILQEASDGCEEDSSAEEGENPNLMERGASECTGLNSDEDPELPEEPEDEEEANDANWDGG
ncbi:hypothetical protein PInf_002463 [Phytophthora infestans]|nr:hypothetical protein PInf_002463 [Phytophthora infestans]